MFRNFTYRHCTTYGINDSYFNVLSHDERTIGYIDEKHIAAFVRGDNTHFRPVSGWKWIFAPSLRESLGLKLQPL